MALFVDQAIRRARSLAEQGQFDQAEQLYRSVLERFPQNKRAQDGLATINVLNKSRSDVGLSPPKDQVDLLISLFNRGEFAAVIEKGETLSRSYPRSVLLCDILGAANAGMQRLEPAIFFYSRVIQLSPNNAEAKNNLGALLQHAGRFSEAIDCYENALKIKPGYAEAQFNLGGVLQDMGRHSEAIDSYERALQIKPEFPEAYNNLGAVLKDVGRHDEAIACYAKALKIQPDYAELHYNLGAALQQIGRCGEAIDCYGRALELKPDYLQAYNNLGNLLRAAGRHDEAISCYEKALRVDPDNAEIQNNLGATLHQVGRYDESIACYARSLKANPNNPETHNNLGATLREVGRRDEAMACLSRAIEIRPDYAEAHFNLGNALRDAGRLSDAVTALTKALQLNPNFVEAQCSLGGALKSLGRLDEAIASYAKALQIDPDCAEAQAQNAYLRSSVCDWEGSMLDPAALAELESSSGSVSPFYLLSLDDDPARHRDRAERFATERYGYRPQARFAHPRPRSERLRIGYFSADFHNHATMHLMAKLFEAHDRTRFSLHAYSFGPDRRDSMRARFEQAVEVFRDVRACSDAAIAALARQDGVDIAIDLKGYTTDARPGIFSNRTAPIQINYLGYPGTTGSASMDYIVADRIVIPVECQQYYSENVIYLPNSYQVNDNTREISNRLMTRAEMGLPEREFVFCCFNNTYKISPREFDIWMRLLRRIDGSVLWLMSGNPWAMANLRREAKRRGVEPGRLVFAERAPPPEHLARHRLADLFLDTFIYNAHTTASDALWSGLPVLTKLGSGFAARVAASLLSAVGLPELATASAQAYEALAIELATDRERLGDIRRRLAEARTSAPLFNTELFAAHIESAYQQAYRRYIEGAGPGPIEVT